MYQTVEAVVKTKKFYHVILIKVGKYKAPIILKVHACILANREHTVENYAII